MKLAFNVLFCFIFYCYTIKKHETEHKVKKEPDEDSTWNNTYCVLKRKKPVYFLDLCFHPINNSFTNAKMTTYHNTACFSRCSKITNIVHGKINQMQKSVSSLFRLILNIQIQ